MESIKKPSFSNLALGGIILLTLVILTSFQNCGTQDYTNTIMNPTGTSVDSSNIDSIPFAFDFKINQISYMSCSRSSDKINDSLTASKTHLNNSNAFFTFKAGAYDNAGLTFRSEFINYVKKTYTFKNQLSDSEIQNAIALGSQHSGSSIQLSVRGTTPISSAIFAPSTMVSNSSSAPPEVLKDYSLFPYNSNLTTTEYLPQLVALFKNPTVRLNKLGTAYPAKLESALHYEKISDYDEAGAQFIRNEIEGGSYEKLLTVTYSYNLKAETGGLQPPSAYIARSANTELSTNLVWGSGFKVKFTSPTDGWIRPQKNNVLLSVKESDLSVLNQTSNSAWTCPPELRYMIISKKDINVWSTSPCTDTSNGVGLNSVQLAQLNILLRHLPKEEWAIDVLHQCIYPRKDSDECYGSRNLKPVDYSKSGANCGYNGSDGSYYSKSCAEFFSVCIRN